MAIQNKKEIETVSVYDPTLQAYHEISLDDYKIQLESLGLSQEEVSEKVKKVLEEKKKKLIDFGVDEETANKILKAYEQ